MMTQEEAEVFFHKANTQIDIHLKRRLHLLGIYPDNLKDPSNKLRKMIVEETDEYIKEEYSAMGILLFWVVWSKERCDIYDPEIDEADLPYNRD